MQHRLANQVRQYLSMENRSVAWFASSRDGFPGIGVDRMRRMLRGETMMQVTDIMVITGLIPRAQAVAANAVGYDVTQAGKFASQARRFAAALKKCTCNVWRDSQNVESLLGIED